jgi:hypothetical protein
MNYNALDFLTGLFGPDALGPSHTLLTPGVGVDDLDGDWRVWFEERAAIMEYDGGLSREHAEALALAETIRAMRREGIVI